MTDSDIYTQWQKLCDEHASARDAYFKAFTIINKKFMAIGQGESSINPTNEELLEFEKTWNVWKDIKKRMSNFVNKHT